MSSTDPSIIVESTQTIHRLYKALDTRRDEDAADCFAADGVWMRQGAKLQGRAEILKALASRSPAMKVHHVVSNLVVDEEGGSRAASTFYLTLYRDNGGAAEGTPAPLAGPAQIGPCKANLVRENGAWRLAYVELLPPTFAASP